MEEDEDGDSKFVWNPECPVVGHTLEVNSVDFSPDGNRVASGSSDNSVKIWDAEAGVQVIRFVGVL